MAAAAVLLWLSAAHAMAADPDPDLLAREGIHRLESRHLVLYTDLALADAAPIPALFDAAVPAWRAYFGIPAERTEAWRMVGCLMGEREPFRRAGLLPSDLPDFPHGYTRDDHFWAEDQPSDYFRGHLVLHEGTHGFMFAHLGGCGPAWYMEGLAEHLATHRATANGVELGVFPKRREDFPYWGRIKVLALEREAGRVPTLDQVLELSGPFLDPVPYAWSWGACAFLDRHPRYQAAFRRLLAEVRAQVFVRSPAEVFGPLWPRARLEFERFARDLDYGYDFDRLQLAWDDVETEDLTTPNAPAPVGDPASSSRTPATKLAIDAARGWQPTPWRVAAEASYRLSARGEFTLADVPRPWRSEAEGVTIRYYRGQPLGRLLATVLADDPAAGTEPAWSAVIPLGTAREFVAPAAGRLYLRLNDAPAELADNAGHVEVQLAAVEPTAGAEVPRPWAAWSLDEDGRDDSGHDRPLALSGVGFQAEDREPGHGEPSATSAVFDGRASRAEAVDSRDWPLGQGDFSVSLWVHTAAALDDAPGGLVAKYDPDALRGWELSLIANAGTTSAQANDRLLQFGLRNGPRDVEVADCGRPGEAVLVFGLAVWNGELYAGTCEPASGQTGRVYRWADGQGWLDCGAPDGANSVSALAVHQGALYAATARYRLRGSALPESPNQTLGGAVYRFEPPNAWIPSGRLDQAEAVAALCEFEGALYATSLYSPGLFRYAGEQRWTPLGSPDGKRTEALCPFDGALYAGSYDGAQVYRYRPDAGWETVGSLAENTQTYGLAVWGGRLHVGLWPSGSVARLEPDGSWTNLGQLGTEKEVMPLAVYHGALVGGTLPLAELYAYRRPNAWDRLARLDRTPDVTYRRVWSLAVYQGALWAGTLPSGHVFRVAQPGLVTWDRSFPPGWHHVCAARRETELALWVDGRRVATGRLPEVACDVRCDRPLVIGEGSQDRFLGRLRDVQVFDQALSDEQITHLSRPGLSPLDARQD